MRRLTGPVKSGTQIIKAGQMLILPTGRRPILGRQILYFEDKIFEARSRILPPVRSDDLVQAAQFAMTP